MLIDTLRTLLTTQDKDASGEAMKSLADFVSVYDSYAPTWAQAPEWANRYSIDRDGQAWWIGYDKTLFAGFVPVLPLGLDNRLCRWRRDGRNDDEDSVGRQQ